VKEDIPQEEWTVALSCMRTWGPVSTSDDNPWTEEKLEKLTTEFLWLSALITELEKRESALIEASHLTGSTSSLLH
jgi:hypothetical protein